MSRGVVGIGLLSRRIGTRPRSAFQLAGSAGLMFTARRNASIAGGGLRAAPRSNDRALGIGGYSRGCRCFQLHKRRKRVGNLLQVALADRDDVQHVASLRGLRARSARAAASASANRSRSEQPPYAQHFGFDARRGGTERASRSRHPSADRCAVEWAARWAYGLVRVQVSASGTEGRLQRAEPRLEVAPLVDALAVDRPAHLLGAHRCALAVPSCRTRGRRARI